MEWSELPSVCLSSSISGFTARLVCHPLDTIKARIQAPGGEIKGVVSGLRGTLASEGLRGLYRGFAAVALGGTPATCLYLTSYEAIKRVLEQRIASFSSSSSASSSPSSPSHSTPPAALVHLSAGLLAEVVSCVVFVPVDVVKERLQVQGVVRNHEMRQWIPGQKPSSAAMAVAPNTAAHGNGGASPSIAYRGSWDALRIIIRDEGVRGVYKGYGATLLSFGPFSAMYFAFYEQARAAALERFCRPPAQRAPSSATLPTPLPPRRQRELPPWMTLACASWAGAVAAWITSPLDMAKLRMQVERRGSGSGGGSGAKGAGGVTSAAAPQYPTMLKSIARIYAREGTRGLWKGAFARMIFTAPNTAITMAVYEKTKTAFQ